MKKYAFLIGNSEFPDEPDQKKLPTLACPEKDVNDLAAVLADVNRGDFEVLTLKNQASHLVLRKLQQTIKLLQADDLLLVYYSGHGKPNKNNILHLTTVDTVISELESTAIPIHRVYEIIATGKAKKIIIILDCCYSGAAGQGFRGDINDGLQQLNNSRGTYLVTASTELQVAHENTSDGYGLFTKHLIAGLTTGAADKDGDGFISMNELYDYVHDNVIAENPNQQPTRHVKDERGGLIIAKSGRDSRKDLAVKIENSLYSLMKDKRISLDIYSGAVYIIQKPVSELSELEKIKDKLISELFAKKDTLSFEDTRSFYDAWKLAITEPTTEKAEQEKVKQAQLARDKEAQDKAAKEKAEQEKIKQAQLARDKQAQNKAAREKAKQEKATQAQLARDKQAQDKAVKEKAEQKKIKQAQLARDKQAQDKAAKEQAAKQDQYGRYFDLTVNNVIQRFRWIEAGAFLMGSPANEPERYDNEKQHSVTLSQGYWLADTACTQALWLAVMANNPANFKDDVNNPVEQVSWDDIQAFLSKLKHLIPDLNPRLPTEAEWEYACRAGTTTAFSFGDTLTPEQVNYDGNYPYGAAKKGLYRKKTVAVKSLPPNAWGLYEMHGNVWEWCNDGYGDYPNKSVTNPTGATEGTSRVLRGGSWSNLAWGTRSAFRYNLTPDYRGSDFGFRFALGQIAR